MGLDMFLTGERYFRYREPARYRRKSERFELGYWRKHPNLHGFIVEHFANGIDDCREIPLDDTDLQRIIDAVRGDQLPHTEGFFFGASDGSETDNDLAILTEALEWLTAGDEQAWRTVIYQASW